MPRFPLCGCHAILELFRHLRRHAQHMHPSRYALRLCDPRLDDLVWMTAWSAQYDCLAASIPFGVVPQALDL